MSDTKFFLLMGRIGIISFHDIKIGHDIFLQLILMNLKRYCFFLLSFDDQEDKLMVHN